MFGARRPVRRGARDEAEKPFWISFSDLMTALMVLFLVVMGVALLAVTREVSERQRKEETHRRQIAELMDAIADEARRMPGVHVDKDRGVIDFGDRARFAFGKSVLTDEQEAVLRGFVPSLLHIANNQLGQAVLKRVVVEGYTDRTGSYLSNLNLSLQRSQRVLCAMFATSGAGLLDTADRDDVRRLFLVGGYSFNASKASDEESRRVEMRIEFLGIDEKRPDVEASGGNFGECALR